LKEDSEMVRKLAIVVGLGVVLAAGAASAASKCDSGVTKATGTKVSCKCGVYAKAQAKGLTPDPAKLQKCTDKFTASCNKAKSAGDCSVQVTSCAGKESQADTFVLSHCAGSPSGAFLN
jgi:hypothetical protein